MKHFKTGISLFVIALAIGASAYTTAPQKLTASWFRFTGSDASNQDQLNNPENYEKVDAPVCGTSAAYRCEILIEPQSGNPDLPDLDNSTIISQTQKSTPN